MILFLAVALFLCIACNSNPTPLPADNCIELLPVDSLVTCSDGIFSIGSMCFTKNGNLVLLDDVTGSLHVYQDNEHIASLSCIGEGPLEYTSPRELTALPEGGFMLNCPPDMKFLFFDETLECTGATFFHDFDLRPGTPVRTQFLSKDLFVGQSYFCSDFSECGTEVSVWRINDDLSVNREYEIRTRFAERFHPIKYLIDTRIASAVEPDNQIIVFSDVTTNNYELNLIQFSEGIDVTETVTREFQTEMKTDEEIEAEVSRIRQAWIRGTGSDIGFQYEANKENFVIIGLYFASNSSLWVRRNSPFRIHFDVFNGEFSFQREVALAVPDEYMTDGWLVAFGDAVIAVSPVNPEIDPVVYFYNIENL
ncbi:hypothetical protein CSA37_12570 [Candidatus Fermentibacteria bacterium]|nr:MAG: hypothetical protein CSA37_12570 [Candidatus Fermentibacteria bacterium]